MKYSDVCMHIWHLCVQNLEVWHTFILRQFGSQRFRNFIILTFLTLCHYYAKNIVLILSHLHIWDSLHTAPRRLGAETCRNFICYVWF